MGSLDKGEGGCKGQTTSYGTTGGAICVDRGGGFFHLWERSVGGFSSTLKAPGGLEGGKQCKTVPITVCSYEPALHTKPTPAHRMAWAKLTLKANERDVNTFLLFCFFLAHASIFLVSIFFVLYWK